MFMIFTGISAQAQIALTGTVVDENNEPMIGIGIVVKNSTIGTATDIDGKFSITVPNTNSVLNFSFIGYKSQEITVGSQRKINVVLKEDLQLLDEVVVVGYGTQKKANLTGAVAQVSGEVLENRPIVSVGQGLQGVIPNLNVNIRSGAPGQSSSFNVRGNTSLNGGSPLVLVDNVQMDLDLINPEDIASISVLKDAASASIYGARAAYGVILVTTKNGKRDQKPQVSFNTQGYWQSPAKKIETINSMEYLKMIDIAYQNGGGSGHYFNPAIYEHAEKYYNDPKNNSPVFYDPEINPNKYQYAGNTNWWNEIYKSSSFSQQYNIGITGGSKNSTYYTSVGYNNVNGLLKEANDNYQRFNINTNVSSDIAKWLNVSGKVMYNHSKEVHPSGGTSAANSTAYAGISNYSGYLKNDLSPLMPVRHPNGNFAGQGSYTNPIAIQSQGGNSNIRVNDLWTTAAVKITPLEGLVVNGDYTFNVYNRGQKTHVRKFLDYTAVPGTENYYPWTNPNSVVMANDEDYYTALNAFAEYTKTFKEDHNFKIMGGYNQEYKHNRYFYAARKDLIDNNNPSINLATGERLVNGNESHWSVNGVFMRLNYNYRQKYLLELNGRYDGSSKFPKDNRYAFFPSVSGAWRISEETFWTPMKTWWDDMKIRASYGSLGNQTVDGLEMGNFPYLPSYSVNTAMAYLLNGDTPVAIGPSRLVSPFFTWETVNQVNLGIDATFLKNRLTASFDVYRRDTKDMLTSGQALPAVLGASVTKQNAADMKTTGFELSLAWNQVLPNGLRYWVRGVLADYQSEITRFINPTGDLGQYYVGQKLGEIWGYRSNGLFQSDEEVKNSPSQSALWGGNWGAGDVKYLNLDGDDKISWGDNTLDNPGDKTIIGNNTPRYSFGFTAGFEYKGFDFEMFWQGVGKRDYATSGVHFWGFTSEWDVPLKESLDYWTADNPGAYFARPNWNNGGNREISDRYIQNAAYARLKNLTVGYTLPRATINKMGISKLRLFLVGENLLTFTNLIKSFDPETIDNMAYPIMRKYSIGLNLTF
ncbi:SusC/RagA family TonB-linked outer membrane protein [Dysgonomonas alginatilytica]|nr:TonB-dependent receptor [Dysgonomonas alginatilytica]